MKTIITLTILAACISCGSSKSGVPVTDNVSIADPLEGTKWKTACLDETVYEVAYAAGGNSTIKMHVYTDANCATEEMIVSAQRSYSLNGQNIDYVFQNSTATIIDQSLLDDCNNSGCFGMSNWTLNVAQNVGGKAFDASSDALQKAGDKLFQIFKITDNKLEFGDVTQKGEDGLTVESRPTSFDMTIVFMK